MLRACGARKRDQRLVFKVLAGISKGILLRALGASRRGRFASRTSKLGASRHSGGKKRAKNSHFGYFWLFSTASFSKFSSDATHRIGFNPALRAGLEAKNGQKMTKMAIFGCFQRLVFSKFQNLRPLRAGRCYAPYRLHYGPSRPSEGQKWSFWAILGPKPVILRIF